MQRNAQCKPYSITFKEINIEQQSEIEVTNNEENSDTQIFQNINKSIMITDVENIIYFTNKLSYVDKLDFLH